MAKNLIEIKGNRYRRVPSLWDCTGCIFSGTYNCSHHHCIDYDDCGDPAQTYILVAADDPRTDAEIQRNNARDHEAALLRRMTNDLLAVTQRSTLRRIAEKLLMRLSEVPDGADDPWISEQLRGYR